ncbi:MAG: GtrA family protein [Patescibacteria group bacterium]
MKKDLQIVTIIGAGVGLFVQFVIQNLVDTPDLLLRLGIFFACFFFAPFALFVAALIGKVFPVAYQFAKFAAVGTLNNAIDFGVVNLAIFLSGIASGWGYSIFKTVSFVAGTTNSFFWNKFWTFGAMAKPHSREVMKFYSFAIVGGIINVGIASFVVNGIHVPTGIAPKIWANIGGLAGVAGSLIWDFIAYKFFVFKKQSHNLESIFKV